MRKLREKRELELKLNFIDSNKSHYVRQGDATHS